jgi:hypothetical protein
LGNTITADTVWIFLLLLPVRAWFVARGKRNSFRVALWVDGTLKFELAIGNNLPLVLFRLVALQRCGPFVIVSCKLLKGTIGFFSLVVHSYYRLSPLLSLSN